MPGITIKPDPFYNRVRELAALAIKQFLSRVWVEYPLPYPPPGAHSAVLEMNYLMNKDSRIYIVGHRGLVGSVIHRELERLGYTNVLTRTRAELDLLETKAVNDFLGNETAPIANSLRGQLIELAEDLGQVRSQKRSLRHLKSTLCWVR